MPAVRDGLAAAGETEGDFAVIPEIIVSVGDDHTATRRLLAFLRLDARLPPGARDCTAGATCSPN